MHRSEYIQTVQNWRYVELAFVIATIVFYVLYCRTLKTAALRRLFRELNAKRQNLNHTRWRHVTSRSF